MESAKCTVIDMANSTLDELKTIIDGLKLESGRAMGKADKTDLSHEAVWGITARDGSPVVVITGPVTKKFAVNLLYKGQPVAKPKMDFVLDSKIGDITVMTKAFEMLQDRLLELAKETIPVQSTHPAWKGKASKLDDEFPKLIKPGKEYSKDGVSGQYDPSFTLSLRVPNENDMADHAAAIAAYEVPSPDKIAKGHNDLIEAYVAALRKLPPFTWGVKIKSPTGELVPNDVLTEKKSITTHVMFELNSLMIKPIKQLSLQMPVRQLMLCEVATNKRRLEDADLDNLWRPMPAARAAAAAAAEADSEGAEAEDDY